MPERKIPHKAIVGLNVYVYEEDTEGSLKPGVKYRKNFTLMAEGCSQEDCIQNALKNVKETQDLWIKNLKTN